MAKKRIANVDMGPLDPNYDPGTLLEWADRIMRGEGQLGADIARVESEAIERIADSVREEPFFHRGTDG